MTKLEGWRMAAAAFLLCGATVVPVHAQDFTRLVGFKGNNGEYPYSGLAQGRDGNFYGATAQGGTTGGGTGFRVSVAGILSEYSFCSQANCTDGSLPEATPVLGMDGSFYGTTFGGGANGDYGTAFKITPFGMLNTLYSFCSQASCIDGANPEAGLVLGLDGNLYGTTYYGGGAGNGGTVFKITSSGKLTTLYSFCSKTGCSDGQFPMELLQATSGDFYGTTRVGGVFGHGTVFRITSSGTLTTLYSFCSNDYPYCADGAFPAAGLIQATDGTFYGTTIYGGPSGYYGGTVFRISSGGSLTTVYTFCSQTGCADGGEPTAALVQATDGNFYGTTRNGGASNQGTIFELSAGDVYTTLYSFCSQSNCDDGLGPYAALVQSTDGSFYGTASEGGGGRCDLGIGCGTVFRLETGLGPFVAFVRGYGKVGQTSGILGQGFTGTTNVSLNGIPAEFKVVSDTYLTAPVPPGATTGYVTVTTPSGTLTSNVPFHVLP